MKILVTGAAGFIGFHICKKFIKNGIDVLGVDNLNNYYDVTLKKNRVDELLKIASEESSDFNFLKIDLTDKSDVINIFKKDLENDSQISIVIHLAAQAGVRYSIKNPEAYIQSNLVGFCNLIEQSKNNNVKHFFYASSSSVYGGNINLPFNESDTVDHPISLYAATKKSNELIAHTYSHLFRLPTTGLRFFTVYGPWGRPDMALFKFTDLIMKNKPIKVFNYGDMLRDFTFIDDVVESIFRLIKVSTKINKAKDKILEDELPPYRIFNIGNSKPTKLSDYIQAIEKNLKKKAQIIYEPMQPGDVKATYANTKKLEDHINFRPNTSIDEGIGKFINWYLEYYEQKF